MRWKRIAAGLAGLAACLGRTTLPAIGAEAVVGPAGAGAAAGWHARPATYGVHETQDVKVTMSDGTTLRVDVYRPADSDGQPADGRFPVILTQTPYNKSAPQLNFYDEYLVTH